MARKNDFQERKDLVLGIVVHQYLETVAPVSSAYIAQEDHLDLSSATIRNILAELEETGYLTHPHTSAGRVPTQAGYRYYVDHLMTEIELLTEEKDKIKAEYQNQVIELEMLLEKTSEVISQLTRYPSIISIDGSNRKVFCHGASFVAGYPEFHDFQKIQEILEGLEEKEQLLSLVNRTLEKKIGIYIGQEIACANFEDCSLAVSSYQKVNGPSGRIAVLGPTRMNYQRVVSTLDYFSDLMSEIL